VKNPKDKVALKLIRREYLEACEDHLEALQSEVAILSGCNHKNIVKVLASGSDGTLRLSNGQALSNLVYIIMEYVPGQTLFDHIQKQDGLGERQAKAIFNQLLDALEYMECRSICHRDIKLENILIDKNLNVKLVDFGFATVQGQEKLATYVGT